MLRSVRHGFAQRTGVFPNAEAEVQHPAAVVVDRAVDGPAYGADLDALEEEVRGIKSELEERKAEAAKKADDGAKEFDSVLNEFESKRGAMQEEFAKIKRELNSDTVISE